jgi:hypothetical protein
MATTETELKPLPLILVDCWEVDKDNVDNPAFVRDCEARLMARAEGTRLYQQGLRQQVLKLKFKGFDRETTPYGALRLTLHTMLVAVEKHDGMHMIDIDGSTGAVFVEFVPLRLIPASVPEKCRDYVVSRCLKCGAEYAPTPER